MISLFSNAPKSDPKLKEGIVNWVKDQFDPEMLKTWYGLSVSERMCLNSGMMLSDLFTKKKTEFPEKLPADVHDFVQRYCPQVVAKAEALRGSQKLCQKRERLDEQHQQRLAQIDQ
jgi:hypothetical protein